MDDVLHHERLRCGAKRLHRRNIDELPDGAFAAFDQTAFAIQGDTLLRWTPNGYHGRKPRPHRISVDVPHRRSSRSYQLATGLRYARSEGG
jgi:hypothetical protein